jgi:hypothetical protein
MRVIIITEQGKDDADQGEEIQRYDVLQCKRDDVKANVYGQPTLNATIMTSMPELVPI